ncbi:tryptophan synthase beta subunit-like PLP-dependent enzyme [Tothia fuscella]|uniref:Tryptophan synthase beta subunit-like PLP-dependent enzyme n=1 Tax=Tothia fuscella TaxID=1048955 RepID=A0A9P4P0V0_9PEZI|nr:tryptophan synthase beta subunit-like PLP-dependent enzyme [Tothia fuscella]
MYLNPSARTWTCKNPIDPKVLDFHRSLPEYAVTPLTPLCELAKELGIGHVFVKDESNRFGLPAFKILGASWAVYCAVCAKAGLPSTVSIEELGQTAKAKGIRLVTCSEGNWGRSVARMGKYLGIDTTIYVPRYMDEATQVKIRSEGAIVEVVKGEYDDCIVVTREEADRTGALLVMDTSWEGYEKIPGWVTEGYSTMLMEVDQQVAEAVSEPVTLAIASVGVGSWAHSVVAHFKSKELTAYVATVESTAAPCLNTSLNAGQIVPVETGETIMNGMNCGTVSSIAWSFLRDGVDASVVIPDIDAHEALLYLNNHGVSAGPCGAAPLVALLELKEKSHLDLGPNSIVVLFCTEGAREYAIPY